MNLNIKRTILQIIIPPAPTFRGLHGTGLGPRPVHEPACGPGRAEKMKANFQMGRGGSIKNIKGLGWADKKVRRTDTKPIKYE